MTISCLSILALECEYFDWKNVAESLVKWTLEQGFNYRVHVEDEHYYCGRYPSGERLLWAFIDRGHTCRELLAELEVVWPRICEGGILAGHDYRQPSWSEVAPTIDAWASERNLDVHFAPPYSFWIQKPGGDFKPFRIWNQRVSINIPIECGFNPSICRHPFQSDKRVMAFRSVEGRWESGKLWIGNVDSGDLQFIDSPTCLDLGPSGVNYEDPRLYLFDSKVWMSYCVTNWSTGITRSRQELVSLRECSKGQWVRDMNPLRFGSPYDFPQEKNWIFFERRRNELLVLYSSYPEWEVHQMSMRSPGRIYQRIRAPEVVWPYGKIRGGTPFLVAPNGKLWTFFHSSHHHEPERIEGSFCYYSGVFPDDVCRELRTCAGRDSVAPHGRYLCGLIEVDPRTFLPVRVSHEPLLYENPPGSGRFGEHVVWRAGAFREGDAITLAYGLDDCSCRCAVFSAKLLDRLLIPVLESDSSQLE